VSRQFPFRPKSTASLAAGDFWVIPLRRGGWNACGRVLEVHPASRTTLTVGLMDWCEPEEPTTEGLENSRVLDYGVAHIKCIWLTGERIVGTRPLALDGGLEQLLAAARNGSRSTSWGYLEIENLAHKFFGRHFVEGEGISKERPPALGEG
jgi:hypothetical protein